MLYAYQPIKCEQLNYKLPLAFDMDNCFVCNGSGIKHLWELLHYLDLFVVHYEEKCVVSFPNWYTPDEYGLIPASVAVATNRICRVESIIDIILFY